jgi:hypothetical protein
MLQLVLLLVLPAAVKSTGSSKTVAILQDVCSCSVVNARQLVLFWWLDRLPAAVASPLLCAAAVPVAATAG